MDRLRDTIYDTKLMHKIMIFFCGLIGFILTVSEVKSYSTFQKHYKNAHDFNMEFVDNESVRYIYKFIMIFVILTRKYTWYPYIIVYFVFLCALVLEAKTFYAPWLWMSAMRSLFINAVVVFTGLWFGIVYNCNASALLEFCLFKSIQIGFSASFWHTIWTQYKIPLTHDSHLLLRKRRSTFHGFERRDELSRSSINLPPKLGSSSSDFLNESPHQSDHEFVNAVHRSRSMDSIVGQKMVNWFVKEANAIDEDESSSFSFDLAVRAERFLKLTPEEIAAASSLKTTAEVPDERCFSMLLRLLPLLTVDASFINPWDGKSELELKVIDMSRSASMAKSSRMFAGNESPLTQETFFKMFTKYHSYYEPKTIKAKNIYNKSSVILS